MNRAALLALAAPLLACAPACGSSAPSGTGGSDAGAQAAAWQAVYDDTTLGGAVLSAWGAGPSDLYVVGGPLGNTGFEAVALHFDGAAWTKLSPGGADSFWWVYGTGPTDVWMVGDNGRITHWDGAAFVESPRMTTARIWGVWAASPTDAWAVGGTPEGGTAAPNDLVYHWDGTGWSQVTLPGAPLGRSLNKVWGTSSEDLYVVGEDATVWHRTGTTWALMTNPSKSTLLTTYGCSAKDVYAVGGQDVIHGDGTTWTEVAVTLDNSVNGVTCDPASGEVLIVGFGGMKQRLVGGAWIDDFSSVPHADLHGSWSDGQGAFWVAGGDFVSDPVPGAARRATIGRYGIGIIAPPPF
jgi:hypothetical protein